jgi:hypothetical protein
MIHLQCTQSVLKILGVKPAELRQAEDTDAVLGNWTVTDLVINRRHAYLFMSDKTLLSFILLEGKRRLALTNVQDMLLAGLSQLLGFLEVPPADVARVLNQLDVVAITKTKDRSLLGNLTSLADEYQHRIHFLGGIDRCDLTKVILSANSGPQRRLGWASSTEITREILGLKTPGTRRPLVPVPPDDN